MSDPNKTPNDSKQPGVIRAAWERPLLRQMAVNQAEHGTSILNDGSGGGEGNPEKHS